MGPFGAPKKSGALGCSLVSLVVNPALGTLCDGGSMDERMEDGQFKIWHNIYYMTMGSFSFQTSIVTGIFLILRKNVNKLNIYRLYNMHMYLDICMSSIRGDGTFVRQGQVSVMPEVLRDIFDRCVTNNNIDCHVCSFVGNYFSKCFTAYVNLFVMWSNRSFPAPNAYIVDNYGCHISEICFCSYYIIIMCHVRLVSRVDNVSCDTFDMQLVHLFILEDDMS